MMELFTSVICTTLTQINLREEEAALQDINGEEKESEAVNSSEREFNRNDSAANHKSLSGGSKEISKLSRGVLSIRGGSSLGLRRDDDDYI